MKNSNTYNQINNLDKNVEINGFSNENVFEFENICYNSFYSNLVQGFIYGKVEIFNTLEFFVRTKDTEKINKIVSILNKYYNGFLTEKFNEFITNEEFEKCEMFKNIIK